MQQGGRLLGYSGMQSGASNQIGHDRIKCLSTMTDQVVTAAADFYVPTEKCTLKIVEG